MIFLNAYTSTYIHVISYHLTIIIISLSIARHHQKRHHPPNDYRIIPSSPTTSWSHTILLLSIYHINLSLYALPQSIHPYKWVPGYCRHLQCGWTFLRQVKSEWTGLLEMTFKAFQWGSRLDIMPPSTTCNIRFFRNPFWPNSESLLTVCTRERMDRGRREIDISERERGRGERYI